MVRFQTVKQRARFILNSDDAAKDINTDNTIPVVYPPIEFDGSQGIIVNIALDTINFKDHSFRTPDSVTYTTSGTAIGGLTHNGVYNVIRLSDDTFQLATSQNNATAVPPVPINLTSSGTGEHTFTKTLQFDGSDGSIVLVDEDQILLTAHNLEHGDVVKYSVTGVPSSPIGGLTNNTNYLVIVVDNNHISLSASIEDWDNGRVVEIQAVGTGTTHKLQKSIKIDSSSTPIVDLANNQINIPAHNLDTGDRVQYKTDGTVPITPLADNLDYYVIAVDANSIQLAYDENDANNNVPLNLTGIGNSQNHSLTKHSIEKVPVCTNYRFKFDNLPLNLNDKCRLSVQSFEYVKNYGTFNCSSIGGVYVHGLHPVDVYQSQGNYKGLLLLPNYFGESFHHTANTLEDVSYNLPANMAQILQNGLDIFVDTKKKNYHNVDIKGCIDADSFNLTLVVYEIDDYEYITNELNDNTRNYHSAAKVL